MKHGILKALLFMGMLLQLIPCGSVRAEDLVDARTLDAQADMRWQQTFQDAYGREIAVDIRPIMPDVEAVPVLRAVKPECTADGVFGVYDPSKIKTTEEYFGTILSYADPASEDQLEIRLFSRSNGGVSVDYVNLRTEIESDPSKLESFNGETYCSNQAERTRTYLDGYEMTVQDFLTAYA